MNQDKYLRRHYVIDGRPMTAHDYAKLLTMSEGKCWICGRPPKTRRLHVDHDHKTGETRGLLCFHCNVGLKKYSDDPRKLRAAADYLERRLSFLLHIKPGSSLLS